VFHPILVVIINAKDGTIHPRKEKQEKFEQIEFDN